MTATGAGIFWIASYPKSGNTWVRGLIASLLTGGDAPALLSRIGKICPHGASREWIEEVLDVSTEDMTPVELTRARADATLDWTKTAGPRLLKIHDHYDSRLFPAEATAGTVFIVRDPRDVAPSWAHHMDVSLDIAIDRMGTPDFTLARSRTGPNPQAEQRLGSWSNHAASWLEQKSGPLLLLRYEALLADPMSETTRLAVFLGLATDAAAIGRAVATCHFESLRKAETTAGFREKLVYMDRFFRQGQAGAWRETLTSEQAARLTADHGAVMARLGYDTAGS